MAKPAARQGDMHTCPAHEGNVANRGGPDIGVARARRSDYTRVYNKYGYSEKARESIRNIFGNKEIISTTKATYSDYDRRDYDNKYGETF